MFDLDTLNGLFGEAVTVADGRVTVNRPDAIAGPPMDQLVRAAVFAAPGDVPAFISRAGPVTSADIPKVLSAVVDLAPKESRESHRASSARASSGVYSGTTAGRSSFGSLTV